MSLNIYIEIIETNNLICLLKSSQFFSKSKTKYELGVSDDLPIHIQQPMLINI